MLTLRSSASAKCFLYFIISFIALFKFAHGTKGSSNDQKALSEKVCNLPSDSTDCEMPMPSWYFDAEKKRCESFVYGGCGGNANRFSNKQDCETFCYRLNEDCWIEDFNGDYWAHCGSNSCFNKKCPGVPDAKCKNNNCTNCGYAFFDEEGRDVTNQCQQAKVLQPPPLNPADPCATLVCGECKHCRRDTQTCGSLPNLMCRPIASMSDATMSPDFVDPCASIACGFDKFCRVNRVTLKAKCIETPEPAWGASSRYGK